MLPLEPNGYSSCAASARTVLFGNTLRKPWRIKGVRETAKTTGSAPVLLGFIRLAAMEACAVLRIFHVPSAGQRLDRKHRNGGTRMATAGLTCGGKPLPAITQSNAGWFGNSISCQEGAALFQPAYVRLSASSAVRRRARNRSERCVSGSRRPAGPRVNAARPDTGANTGLATRRHSDYTEKALSSAGSAFGAQQGALDRSNLG
jgi:hypothetical protein